MKNEELFSNHQERRGNRLTKEKHRTGKWKYGSVSALMLVMVLIALIALNAGIYALEKKKGWRIDLSFNGITSQSAETAEILKQLKDPVQIWVLSRKGDEDAQLLELLDRYAASSELVTWTQTDPALNLPLVKRFTTEIEAPGTDDLIVYCEKTNRFRILGPEDYVSVGMDTETGEWSYTGWTYERSITGAIAYVTRERIPKAVILQGHQEIDAEKLAYFISLLEANQYEVTQEDLTQSAFEPNPEDLLIFFSPKRDLTEPELKKLTDFAAKGGSFLFTCDFDTETDKMPNFSALMRSYGFVPLDGLVLADPKEKDTYYDAYTEYLLPEMCPTDITMDLITAGANHLLLPAARPFAVPEEGDRNLTTGIVLQSGETSYRKAADATTLDQEEGDETGAFPLALEAVRVTTEGYVSRAFAIGCSVALFDQNIYAMTDGHQFTMQLVDYLLKTDATNLHITPKEAVRPTMGTGSTNLGSVLLIALPMSVLFAALVILGPRRSR